MEDNINKKIIAIIIVVILTAIIGFTSLGTVGAGERGIKTRFNKVISVLDTGLYFKTPFIDNVIIINVQTQKEEAAAYAASKDLQTVTAKVAINYSIDPQKVQDLYVKIGTNYKSKVIDPAIQEVVKAVTAQYTAEDLIKKRPEVTNKVKTGLSERLLTVDILVSSVSITNFYFSASFNGAIEAKVTAEQNALAAKNKLDQIKYEAEQTIVSAKAEAEAITLKSQAANNEKYVSLKALEVQEKAIEKWNGKLPDQMIPNATLPFINVNK